MQILVEVQADTILLQRFRCAVPLDEICRITLWELDPPLITFFRERSVRGTQHQRKYAQHGESRVLLRHSFQIQRLEHVFRMLDSPVFKLLKL